MDPITLSIIGGLASWGVNAWAAMREGEISEQEYQKQLQAVNELERKLKTLRPDETWQNIDPVLMQAAAKYSPDIAAFVQENAPELITEAKSATEKRVQREALQKYSQMAETGRDVVAEAQREQALFEADARAKQRQQRLMEGLKRQGMLGSGAGLAAQLQTEQQERQAAREESIRGVQESEARRRQALSQAATLAGQMRGENLQVESANVNTMNAFNARLANAKNLYNQYSSGERNRAELINQQREMDRSRYNLELGNKYAMYNREQALAARERARQFDVDVLNTIYKARGGAEDFRRTGEARARAGQVSAFNTGIGTGMGLYSIGSKGAGGVKEALVQGTAEGLTSQSVTPSASRQPMGLGVDYSNLTSSEPQESLFIPANIEDIEVNREMSFTPNYNQTMNRNPSNKYNLGMNSQTRNVFDLREEIDPNNFMIQNPYSKKRY
jgi:hypothetical protein